MSLEHCKPPLVARHVSTEKPMSVNVDGQHQDEPQRKDCHPDAHAGPVPGGKGDSTASLLLFFIISSYLLVASRALAARTVLWRLCRARVMSVTMASTLVPGACGMNILMHRTAVACEVLYLR
ncbi:hypothetical protein CYMTET_50550 [Cymbomonas tetramitiformis]|uniref:Uncharacterized protein n=1 Tax=Cymbomonas tetramitiformis TaxID=36881 RepID=A0AAE0EUN1_9CHLO|nr:hypothetical protein CYMTET_50550 [Cymbomonas tetramitiformis]